MMYACAAYDRQLKRAAQSCMSSLSKAFDIENSLYN